MGADYQLVMYIGQNKEMKNKERDILFITILAIGILCLFLNDRIWKYEYGNFLTGKLSDCLGLITLPLFLAILLPKFKLYFSLMVGALFIMWKSPISSPLIEFWNSYQIFELSRVVDHTDFVTLLLLPIVHIIISKYNVERIRLYLSKTIHKAILVPSLIISTLIFCSTSIPEPAYPKGDILIDETYHLKNKTESQILKYFNDQKLTVKEDSIVFLENNRTRYHKYYRIEQFIVNTDRGLDTLNNIHFRVYETMDKSSINIINISVQNNWDLQNWETLKWKTKWYKELIELQIIEEIDGTQH